VSDLVEDDFDDDIAKAAKSNQVSQFGDVLDEIDDLTEDDEVISEFLQGLDDGSTQTETTQYQLDDEPESDAEDNDLFDELFDEDDVYESTQAQETKDSILRAIRDNPITSTAAKEDEDLDLFGGDDFSLNADKSQSGVGSSRSKLDNSAVYGSSKPSMMGVVASIVGVVAILGLAGYSYLLQREVSEMQVALADLQMGGFPEESKSSVDPIKVKVMEAQVKTLVKRMAEVENSFGASAGKGVEAPAVSEEVAGVLAEQSDKMKTLSRTVASMVHDIMKIESGIEDLKKAPVTVAAVVAPPAKKVSSKAAPKTVSSKSRTNRGGRPWVVNIASFANKAAATKALKSMKARGIDAKESSVVVKGRTWHRLRVTGFETQALASKYLQKLKKVPGLSHPWITKQ
jgi:cell division septation protein DedD